MKSTANRLSLRITYCIRSIISKIISSVVRFEEVCTGISFLAETRLVPGGHEAAISLHTHYKTPSFFSQHSC